MPEIAHRRALNVLVLALNWYHLGMPAKAPANYVADAQLNETQMAIVARFVRLSAAWAEASDIAASDMGRSAGKVENMEAMVSALHVAANEMVLKSTSGGGPGVPKRARVAQQASF